MTNPRGGRHLPVAALLFIGLLPIACSTSSVSTPPATTVPSVPAVSPVGPQPTQVPVVTPEPTIEAIPTSPGQSQTAWGTIWNDVPDWFPVPIDAATADPDHGPVSGAWSVPAADVSAIALAGFYRDALREDGWAVSTDGPLEDGSYTIASRSAGGCEALTTILPRGSESIVTVLYGAACPFK